MKNALIIFAKTPQPGFVKTRFQPGLGPEEAALLYSAFVLDTITLTGGLRGLKRMIGCAGAKGKGSAHPFFREIGRKEKIPLFDQSGRTLGERMHNAMKRAFEGGFRKAVIIGSDSPTLPAAYLRDAFRALDRSSVVLGPGLDGGYYLVGAADSVPPIFSKVDWGSPRVLNQTLARLQAERISPHLLPFWYDVDTSRDLRFLVHHLRILNRGRGFKIACKTGKTLKKVGF